MKVGAATKRSGMAHGVDPGRRSTFVRVLLGDDLTSVEVPRQPDSRAARAVERGFRRLAWQEIDLTGVEPKATVRGLRYRLPEVRSVSVGAALALAQSGLPTVVRVPSGERA